LGKAGETVEVAPGYFRNHLMPKLLAVPNIDKYAFLIREQRKVVVILLLLLLFIVIGLMILYTSFFVVNLTLVLFFCLVGSWRFIAGFSELGLIDSWQKLPISCFTFSLNFCTGQLYQKEEEEVDIVKETKAADAAKVIYLPSQKFLLIIKVASYINFAVLH
jgi:Ribosomal protein L9, N-terminal domain